LTWEKEESWEREVIESRGDNHILWGHMKTETTSFRARNAEKDDKNTTGGDNAIVRPEKKLARRASHEVPGRGEKPRFRKESWGRGQEKSR